jgi:hypothetical protein
MPPSLGTRRPCLQHWAACKMYLHLHSWRSALPCMQQPTLAGISNHFLFFVHILRPTGEESLLFATPAHLPARQILIHSTQDLSFCEPQPRSTMPQPIRSGNHTTTLRLLGEARRVTEGNLEVIVNTQTG